MKSSYRLCAGVFFSALVIGATSAQAARADRLSDILNVEASALRENKKAQQEIDKLADQTKDLTSQYRAVIQQVDSLRVYNGQLQKLITSQEQEMAKIQTDIDGVTTVEREILPLMDEMVDVLAQFVEGDVPFLLEERRTRVNRLKELLLRADVTTAEKYRLLIEAFQIENNFGHTIEAYQSEIELDGQAREVDFLRVGRVALFYQTPDREASGMWDPEAREWIEVDDSYGASIRQGLRIARKQAPPDLLLLPVQTPDTSVAQSPSAGDELAQVEVGQ